MVTAFLAGLGLGLYLCVSVGPVIFEIIKQSLNNGFKAGLSFVIGVNNSDIMYIVLANLAAGLLAQLSQFTYGIGIVGGILLITMGLASGLKTKPPEHTNSTQNQTQTKHHTHTFYFNMWLRGFLINTFNPGVILFWFTVTAANVAKPLNFRILMFGTCLIVVVIADIAKVYFAEKIRHKLTPHTMFLLNRLSALLMIGFGVLLLTDTLLGIKILN